ncbi:hypothetical protein K439DRAFT_160300 [Ramaria rubella]|nr:hypothetical protein K439DRAFT_159335 [Ramaria rubella]KAF8582282.1 hypothetical protein K439DRAFT_160300 [Ramaria rubella]
MSRLSPRPHVTFIDRFFFSGCVVCFSDMTLDIVTALSPICYPMCTALILGKHPISRSLLIIYCRLLTPGTNSFRHLFIYVINAQGTTDRGTSGQVSMSISVLALNAYKDPRTLSMPRVPLRLLQVSRILCKHFSACLSRRLQFLEISAICQSINNKIISYPSEIPAGPTRSKS